MLESGDLGELHYRGAQPVAAHIAGRAILPGDATDAQGWVRHSLASKPSGARAAEVLERGYGGKHDGATLRVLGG